MLTPEEKQALLRKFAPVVYLHSDEEYFPCTVNSFLNHYTKLVFLDKNLGEVDVPIKSSMHTPVRRIINQQTYTSSSYNNKTFYSSYKRTQEQEQNNEPEQEQIEPCAKPQEKEDEIGEFRTRLKNENYRAGYLANYNRGAPFYGAVMESETSPHYDLLYAFFYAWDNTTPLNHTAYYKHEGDWEHIVIRIDSNKETILGTYFQAHKGIYKVSRWYYPPESTSLEADMLFECDPETQRVVVYSAQGSHGSYTRDGVHDYGLAPIVDFTNKGMRWEPYKDENLGSHGIVHMTGEEAWNDYNGKFGTGPLSPFMQNWLKVNAPQGGPNVQTRVDLTCDQGNVRYSKNFKISYPQNVRWTFEIEYNHDKTNRVFEVDIERDITLFPQKMFSGIRNGDITPGYKQATLYVGGLRCIEIVLNGLRPGRVYNGDKVFTTLNITKFTLVATPTTADITPPRQHIPELWDALKILGHVINTREIDRLATGPVIQFGTTPVEENGTPTNTKDANGENGFEIFFEKEFTTHPTVVVTPYWPNGSVPNVETVIKISEKSFVLKSYNDGPGKDNKPYYINWIAIADQTEQGETHLTKTGDSLKTKSIKKTGRASKQFVNTFFTATQYGKATMSSKNTEITIPFPQPFENPPTVVLSQYYQVDDKDIKPIPGKPRIIVTDVSTSGFTTSANAGTTVDYDVCWIARAKPKDTNFIAMQQGKATMASPATKIAIEFPQHFANLPTVVLSQYYQGKPIPNAPILTVTGVSRSGFTISANVGTGVDYDVCWIACAKPGDTNLEAEV